MHLDDWQVHHEPYIPHHPLKNGLRYLYQYSPREAFQIISSPAWTKAIFVRDPKERLLSAYLDKAARKDGIYVYRHCCPNNSLHSNTTTTSCAKQASTSFYDFVDVVRYQCCCDPHWKPQAKRVDDIFWKYMSFVGHFESLQDDTKRLLQNLGIWDDFGASGWGLDGNESIFAESTYAQHKTNAKAKLISYYNQTRNHISIEDVVEELYFQDYHHPVLNLTNLRIL